MGNIFNPCKGCGGVAVEKSNGALIYIECGSCGMRTNGLAASLDYGARERVAEEWNRAADLKYPNWERSKVPETGYSMYFRVNYKSQIWSSDYHNNKDEPAKKGWTAVA